MSLSALFGGGLACWRPPFPQRSSWISVCVRRSGPGPDVAEKLHTSSGVRNSFDPARWNYDLTTRLFLNRRRIFLCRAAPSLAGNHRSTRMLYCGNRIDSRRVGASPGWTIASLLRYWQAPGHERGRRLIPRRRAPIRPRRALQEPDVATRFPSNPPLQSRVTRPHDFQRRRSRTASASSRSPARPAADAARPCVKKPATPAMTPAPP